MNKVYVDKARLLRRVIIISWASLTLCFFIKIFGGNFFEIMCNNQTYKKICEYADTHLWLDIVISLLSTFLCECLFLLSILQKYWFNKKELIITIISVVVATILKIFNLNFFMVADIWITILLPMLLLGKQFKKYWAVLFANLFNFGFQIISLLVKDLGFVDASETYFIGLIYMIDLYIMCLLYYLYRNYQKENEKMGKLWSWFAGKPVDKLKEMKAKREAKKAKLDEEIKAIEAEIERQKNEK